MSGWTGKAHVDDARGTEITVNYNGKPINVDRLPSDSLFFITAPGWRNPIYPRVKGKNVAKTIMLVYKGEGSFVRNGDGSLRRDLCVEDASFYFERDGTPDPYKNIGMVGR